MPRHRFEPPARKSPEPANRRPGSARRPTQRSVALLGAVALSGLVLAACGSSGKTSTTSTQHTSVSSTTVKAAPSALCPLTGTPAPGGVVPERPAIAMKVDNYSLGPAPAEARPQSGLDYADIIFEEQTEGSITRYAAVFQCHNAPSLVGPIRSARWTDVQMLTQLGHPLLVHVGGIVPVLSYIASSPLINVDLGMNPGLVTNPPGRYAPYDTYTTTQAVWSLMHGQPAVAPSPLFSYSTEVPAGPAVTQVHLDWSSTSDIYWRWNPATTTWLRYYNVGSPSVPNIQPDLLSDGVQNQAQNVIVEDVNITFGPWVENSQGGLEAESHLLGYSGKAYIFRSGRVIEGTWSAPSNGAPTTLRDATGAPIALSPGRTWVEIYPVGAPMTVTPLIPAKSAG